MSSINTSTEYFSSQNHNQFKGIKNLQVSAQKTHKDHVNFKMPELWNIKI